MRILIVSQYFWPENFRVNDLAEALMTRGHCVSVLTGLPNYPEGKVFPEFRDDRQRFRDYKGIPVYRVPVISRGDSKLLLILNYISFVITASLIGTLKLRGQKFDVIFVFQTSPITSAIPALLLRRLKRAPVLLWILDLWPDTLSAVGVVKSSRLLAAIGGLVRFIYARCDRILIQSRAFAPFVARFTGEIDKIRYFPGWSEVVFAGASARTRVAAELLAWQGKFVILFAGNIGEAQDFPAILDAAEATVDLPEVQWIIVGDGRAREQVERELDRRNLRANVTMLGRFPLERMPEFFNGADALLVSLKAEPIWAMTIPGKVQSYLASGVPVLAMINGEGARVIQESGGGLVAPAGNGLALALRVRELMTLSPKEREKMANAGMIYGKRHFDRDTLVCNLEDWMREAALPLKERTSF
jgi:colanic acid biosynthesis glycosyl transferase WcaI